ncbi:MAG: M1 family metallopeptidase [Polaribacter sp.]|nr:M1 family metallopeptidase [Polaribacter sp.]MDG1955287.1 M1 family metallopeptidase [Polaribacter sp.]
MKTAIKNTLLLVCFVIFTNAIVVNDGYPKNPNIDIINYIFKIELSDTTDEISVDLTVDVRFVGKGVKKMRLDLINKSSELENKGMTISSVTSNGKPLEYTHKNDEVFIHLKEPSKKNQREQIVVNYKGIPANGLKIGDNMHGDRTFFSDNWPNRGRHWLATVDHPSDKAMCEFIVTAPDHYQIVSNGLKIEETNLDDNKRLTHWKQSVPIASWLYVLGAADFAVQYVDEFDGKSIQTWVFKQDRDAGFYDFAIPTKKALEFYSEYVGPFSYEKLANIQSNSVSGGMEAASAILYSASSVKGDRNTRWRNVVIHEIAHQWFGNAVTEYDWDDIWLSEGFATYFTLLFIEHEYGRDAFVDGLISSQKRVDAFYEKNPKYTIIHDNLKDMKDVTSSQTYQKGSWILHMLRGLVGTDTFWKGIQIYYKKYQDLNATTADFKSVMEEVSGRDLTVFFEQWLYKPGTLNLKGNWKYNKRKGEVTVEFNQVQKDGSVFEMPLEIELDFGNNKKQLEVIQLKGTSNSFQIKVVSEPKSIIVDPNLWVLKTLDFKQK